MIHAIFFLASLCWAQSPTSTKYSNQLIQDVNQARISGTVISTGTGNSDSGTQRVVTSSNSQVNVVNQGQTALTTDATVYYTISVATVSCGSSLVTLLSTNTARVANLICNEGSVAVRIGPSTITTAVGQWLGGTTCMTYDKPRYYRGGIYCISTGAAQAVSATEGTP